MANAPKADVARKVVKRKAAATTSVNLHKSTWCFE
jgi:hypothetical protein